MEERYSETHHTWNKIAHLYEEKFMDLDIYNDSYQRFCDLLPTSSASVLEIGCGPGNITKYILGLHPNLKVLATDFSENMLALAKKNNPSIEAMVLDGRQLHQIHRTFDGIVCGFVVPYLSDTDLSQFIANCANLLNERGVLYISFVPGDYEKSGFVSSSTGHRSYFYYYSMKRIQGLLEANGFSIVDQLEVAYPKADQATEKHTISTAIKEHD